MEGLPINGRLFFMLRVQMNFKLIVKILLAIIAVLFLSATLSNYNIKYNSLFRFILFFYLVTFVITKYGKEKLAYTLLFITIGFYFLLDVDMFYNLFYQSGASLPLFISSLGGIISGFLYVYWKSYIKIVPFLLVTFFTVFMLFTGWDYWLHKINFGTFTGKLVAYKSQLSIEGINEKNAEISNKSIENKIVLLDFWHTQCGVCFSKFPQLQAFYDKYKNDDSIAIFAVDKPIEEDKQKSAFKVIEEEGYSFPVLLSNDEDLPEKFGVKYYPTTFVINKQGNVVYKGGIEGAVLMVEELRKQ